MNLHSKFVLPDISFVLWTPVLDKHCKIESKALPSPVAYLLFYIDGVLTLWHDDCTALNNMPLPFWGIVSQLTPY
jgi:hypothetical protein